MFPLKDQKDVDRVACWQRPPKKYLGADEPWVSDGFPHVPNRSEDNSADARGICPSSTVT